MSAPQPIPATTSLRTIRRAEAQDAPFILHSWRRSKAPFVSHKRTLNYYRLQDQQTAALLERSVTWVATAADGRILGWAAGEPGYPEAIVHWVYVRRDDRHQGIARELTSRLTKGAQRVLVTAPVCRIERGEGGDQSIDYREAIARRGWLLCQHGACYLAMQPKPKQNGSHKP